MLLDDTQERQELNQICYTIRGAFFEVFKELGPGLLEDLCEEALVMELQDRGLKVQRQVRLEVWFKGRKLRKRLRVDLIVEGKVIVELKSVEELQRLFFKQTITYLKVSGIKVGFLVNFGAPFLEDGKSLFRLVNGF